MTRRICDMELCGDCKWYYEWQGKGCCKVRKMLNHVRPTTNMSCLDWRTKDAKQGDKAR